MRLAELIGKIIFKLQALGLHIKHREPLMEFFKKMINHKELKMRRYAAYNLPCFNKLFKEYQDEFDVDFNDIYLKFAKEEDPQIIKTIAASIHEAFDSVTEDENSQKLREAFKYIIELGNRDTLIAITENLDVSLLHYCNHHAVKVIAPLLGGPPKEQP